MSGAFGGLRRRMEHPRTVGLDPVSALRSADSPAGRALMLHSGRVDATHARHSVLARPVSGVAWAGGTLRWLGPGTGGDSGAGDPFDALQEVTGDGALWLGHLSYDLARVVERLPSTAAADRGWPGFAWYRCPGWLEHDAVEDAWFACGRLAECGDEEAVETLLCGPDRAAGFEAGEARPDRAEEEHLRAVGAALRYVAAGDVFQVNVARRWGGRFSGSTAALYAELATRAQPWYGAHLPCPWLPGPGDPTLCSASPEMFLEVRPDGSVRTRPIKGTEAAGRDTLEGSAKDSAELAMIVDLLRNDLGRVCRPGSIAVPEGRAVEEHPTVRHGVATVQGRLAPGRGLADLLRATWPGGSVTGAPKVRAMEIIEELEPVRRGPSYGAIGGIRREPGTTDPSSGWRMSLNLAIRTLCIAEGRYDFHVGGGIVADSTPAAELAETRVKAEAILRTLEAGRRGSGSPR